VATDDATPHVSLQQQYACFICHAMCVLYMIYFINFQVRAMFQISDMQRLNWLRKKSIYYWCAQEKGLSLDKSISVIVTSVLLQQQHIIIKDGSSSKKITK
jgi:hypothetical protein